MGTKDGPGRWARFRRGRWLTGVASLVGVSLLVSCTSESPLPPPTSPSSTTASTSEASSEATSAGAPPASTTQALPSWPSAVAVQAENARPGDGSWDAGVTDPPTTKVEGFVGSSSVLSGQPVTAYLHSTAGPVVVKAYRMGWYAGTGSRLVWTSPPVSKVDQPAPSLDGSTRTWSAANWAPSLDISTSGWPPGDYVLHVGVADGAASLVPVTVRASNAHGSVVLLNSDTTWQAYNHRGGTSLYRGKSGAEDRAYAVSFDRPLDFGLGTGDFIGNEAPVVRLAEKLGLPLAYAADTDLDGDPHLLDGARAVISLGHDEYYSRAMRDALSSARDTQGTNLAFLGANAIYRHIRLGPTPTGERRLETDYKDARLDPVAASNPEAATSQWRQPPRPRPESELTGVYYQCNPVTADMVAADQDSWLLAGTGIRVGDKLTRLAGPSMTRSPPARPRRTPSKCCSTPPSPAREPTSSPTSRTTPPPAGPVSSPPAPAPGSADWPSTAAPTPATNTGST